MAQEGRSSRKDDKSSHDRKQWKDVQKEGKCSDENVQKNLVIVNESKDAKLTLFTYSKLLPAFDIFSTSKIIQPQEKHSYFNKTVFKFKLIANFEDGRKTIVLKECQDWVKDTMITVRESLTCTEKDLTPDERRLCIRKRYRAKELASTNDKPNHYDILGLDMEDVRKEKTMEDQRKKIKKAWKKQQLIWHPDKHNGDTEMIQQINEAKAVLMDDEKRAQHNNAVDYDSGWSKKRFKSIFRSDCYTDEQLKARKKRYWLTGISFFAFFVVGIGLIAGTAGLAAPGLVAAGATFGSAFFSGGYQSLTYALRKASVVEGCDSISWALNGLFGALGGAALGAASVGITASLIGIGSTASMHAAVGIGEYVGIGAATGSIGGVISSLVSDASRKFVDGEKVTWKEVIYHASLSGLIGALVGSAGGAVTASVASRQASAIIAETIRGDAAEQAFILTAGRRITAILQRELSRAVTESALETALCSSFAFLKQRFDDFAENQPILKHVKGGALSIVINSGRSCASNVCSALASHATNEIQVSRKTDKHSVGNRHLIRAKIRHHLSRENNEHLVNWNSATGTAQCKPKEGWEIQRSNADRGPKTIHPPNDSTDKEVNIIESKYEELGDQSYETKKINDVKDGELDEAMVNMNNTSKNQWEDEEPDRDTEKESVQGIIRYRSDGLWFSMMIVTYMLNNKIEKRVVRGIIKRLGGQVEIPAGATQIKVRFKVARPGWGDVMKYDRFSKAWCQPYERHVFCYDEPVDRTFTISGNLWWEAVMRVSDQYHDETGEMC